MGCPTVLHDELRRQRNGTHVSIGPLRQDIKHRHFTLQDIFDIIYDIVLIRVNEETKIVYNT
jgi:hypothetical protein